MNAFSEASDGALARHDEIRKNVGLVLDLARRTKHGEEEACLALAEAMKALALEVRRSVAAEESTLGPHLARLYGGAEQRERLERDLQAEIEAIWNIDYYGSHLAMAAEASAIASGILAALSDEDELIASAKQSAAADG